MASKKLTPPRSLGRQLNYSTGKTNALCQKILDPHDLSLAQWVILSALWRAEKLTVRELADYTGNQMPATSRIIDRMVEKGLLERASSAKDRRVSFITLSKDGRALSHLANFFETINGVLMQGFSKAEQDTLFGLLERVEENALKALE